MVYRVIDPVELEAYACREALALAEDLNAQNILVASDCQAVVNDIKHGTGGAHSAIIREILVYMRSFHSCNFIFEHRNHNFEAHNLAKFACNLGIGCVVG